MTDGPVTIHVIMAVFDPVRHRLEQQIASIATQTDVNVRFHAVIADLSSSSLVEDIAEAAGLSPEIHVPAQKLSAVAAFEFGISEALAKARPEDIFSLCDQDDVWHSDKLRQSANALFDRENCHLVHTDARLVNDDGIEISPSMFAHENRAPETGLRRLLYRNSITGMTSVFSYEVATHSLPFPPQSGTFFYHDLWIGLIAASKGPIKYLPIPTVDYRQHGNNAVGAVKKGDRLKILSQPWLRQRFASFSLAGYLAKSLMLRVEQICMSEPDSFDRRRLKELRPYLRQYGIGVSFFVDAAGYALRGYQDLANHSFSQGVIKTGRLIWAGRKMLKLDFSNRLSEFDEIGYSMAPGAPPRPARQGVPQLNKTSGGTQVWYSYLDERKTRNWGLEFTSDRPATCNILVPTLNPTEIFAGIATALDLGIGLAQRGMKVRFVATDLPLVCPHATRSFLASRVRMIGRSKTLDNIELTCGVTVEKIKFSPFDDVIATAWWTAHLAKTIVDSSALATKHFHYLIQDFEPNFYAWGTEYAGAVETYSMSCVPIFNTTLLRDFFQDQGFSFSGAKDFAFRPSIDIAKYADLDRTPGRKKRRIAVYGRPEVARNMFPICVEALAELVHSQNLTPETTEIVSVGLSHDPILLPQNLHLQSLGKLPIEDYPTFLTTVDIGLSLMYSPHPSHPPIEMAASGAHVVTNHFGPKNLALLSPLIQSCDPTPSSVSKALVNAWKALDEPAPKGARRIDLSPLGQDLDEVAELLFVSLTLEKPNKRVA